MSLSESEELFKQLNCCKVPEKVVWLFHFFRQLHVQLVLFVLMDRACQCISQAANSKVNLCPRTSVVHNGARKLNQLVAAAFCCAVVF
jgi:hypothetical protein